MRGVGNGWRVLSLEMIRKTCGEIAYIESYLVFSLSVTAIRGGWLVDEGRLTRLKPVSADLTFVWFRRSARPAQSHLRYLCPAKQHPKSLRTESPQRLRLLAGLLEFHPRQSQSKSRRNQPKNPLHPAKSEMPMKPTHKTKTTRKTARKRSACPLINVPSPKCSVWLLG